MVDNQYLSQILEWKQKTDSTVIKQLRISVARKEIQLCTKIVFPFLIPHQVYDSGTKDSGREHP